jgi:hypothetical protein
MPGETQLQWQQGSEVSICRKTAVAKRPRELTAPAISALGRLRTAAGTLADVDESLTFGNPTFRVNRQAFAVMDRYQGRDCLWLRVAASDRERLLKRRGWFPSPYDPHRTALCCELEQFDWRRSRHLAPYRNSAVGRAKLLLHRPVRQQALFRRGRHTVYRRAAELGVHEKSSFMNSSG